MVYTDGRVYDGEWSGGKPNGTGLIQNPDGYSLKGQFKDRWPEGYAHETLANGDEFIGHFSKGMKDGRFECAFANGDRFVGTFKDDSMKKGVYYRGDLIYDGEFRSGKPFGNGTLIQDEQRFSSKHFDGFVLNGIYI